MQRTTLPDKRQPCGDGEAEGWQKINTPSGEVWTRQLTQEERAYNELQKAHYPDGRVESFFKILKAPTDIGKEEAASLKKSFLDKRHYTLLLDETGMVLTPDGRVLCILLRSCCIT
jgi:hypothetical protein